MILQGIVLERKGFKEQDWGWLDDLEDERWGDSQSGPKARMSQRDMLQRAREQGLRKLREDLEGGSD